MEQHPIPQDVTGFQFKLIGTMTVKQFGYVACGVIMAVIVYYSPIQSFFGIILKFILIPLFGSSGVIVAFVPVDGRPIDLMTTNFVKAVFSPNQYVYQRQGRQLSFTAVADVKTPTAKKAQEKAQTKSPTANKSIDAKEEKLRALFLNSGGRAKNEMDKKEAAFLKTLTMPSSPMPAAQPAIPQPQLPNPTPLSGFKPAINPISKPIIQSTTAQLPKISPFITKPLIQTPQIQPVPVPAQISKPVNQTPLMQPASIQAQIINPLVQTPQQQPAPVPAQISKPVSQTPLTQPAAIPDQNNAQELSKKESELENELTKAKQEDLTNKTVETHTQAQQKITTLTNQIQEVHSQKEQLEKELSHLQNQLVTQKSPDSITQQNSSQPLSQNPHHVRTITEGNTKKVGLPHISDSPNVVVGIVKDSRGNILPHILVEVKDKDGNPVRAFKTNQLGQFASATPLSPGSYTMELEDPKKQHTFDIIQLTTNNTILLPIEIISHDAREELRKQLFAN